MSKLVLITGGSRGIGAETARLAAKQGYRVCISYVDNKEAADSVINDIQSAGGQAMAVQADIANEEQVIDLFDSAEKAFGPTFALVNNAGILLQQMRLENMTPERINRVFSVNVTGSFICAREAVRRMALSRGGKGGVIVNLSSLAAKLGAPDEYIDYAASKGAIDTMTIGLAKEVAAEAIRVNAVRPGIVRTDIHASGGEPGRISRISPLIPMKRAGEPGEIAKAVIWLISDDSSYVTGALLDIAGGR